MTVAHLADAGLGKPSLGLLERERELATMERLLAAACAGRGALAVVEGPAGIGKTTLLEAAGALAERRSMTVLRARAVPLEQAFSYGVVRQLFEPLALQDDDALLDGAARLARPVLALPVEPQSEAPEDPAFASLHGLYWLTANLASRTPLLLTVDDCPWADAASLRFLAYLGARLKGLRGLVLVALRRGDATTQQGLLGELVAQANPEPLRPWPLGAVAAGKLIRAAVGPSASDRFCCACHEATGGNPLFLGTLAAAVASEGGEPDEATAARVTELGAETIGRLLARRLARLPAGSESFVHALAVLGPRAPLRHVAALAGLELERAAALADALRAAAILAEDDELDFAHPVVGAAIGDGLAPGERSLAHARAAELLAAEDAPAERLALHLLRAPPRGDRDTIEKLRAAAALAVDRGAPEAAATYLRRAIEEPPTTTLRAPLRFELGLALLACRRDVEAPAYLQEAVACLDDPGERREAALHAARALGVAGYFEQAAAMLESVPGQDLRIDAELAADAWHIAARVPLALARLAATRNDVPDRSGSQLIAVMLAHASLFAGDPVSVASGLLEGALGGPELFCEQSLVVVYAAMDLVFCDRLDDAERLCSAVIEAGERGGSPSLVATFAFPRAFARLRRGALRDAEADARWSYEQKLAMDAACGPPWPLAPLLDALTEQGHFAAADETLARLGTSDPAPPEMLAWPFVLEARGRLRLAQGRRADGLADLFEAGRRWESLHCHSANASRWRADAALALARQGELERAHELATEQLRLAEQSGPPRALGIATRALGTVTVRRGGVTLLSEAVTLLEQTPARLELAHALVELGAALRREGHRAEARDRLRHGLELAHRAGAAPLAQRARHELLAAGGRPRRPVFTGVEALTASELRVAQFAATGATNREIAQRLFVTQRTVETHLRHIFQKLDIRTRTELPRELSPRELT
ncbi:MAG: ATP-binding protein [Solirubrobacteraceae bacterium]